MSRQFYTDGGSYVIDKENPVRKHLSVHDVIFCGVLSFFSFMFALIAILMWRTESGQQYVTPAGLVPEGNAVHGKVIVEDVVLRTDREIQQNAEVIIDRWHLVADTGLVLNEGYIDKEQALAMKGMTRNIVTDSSTGGELLNRGLHMWFAIPFALSVVCVFALGIHVVRIMRRDVFL